MSAEGIEYMDDYKKFPTKESALDWLDNYLSLDERNNLIRALQQELVLDKIRAEIIAIAINGQVDEHTMFIRTGDQVKQMALDIIDKYNTNKENKE